MKPNLRANGRVDWYPTLAAAVEAHSPAQIEWAIVGLDGEPRPIEGQLAEIQAFPSAVSVDRDIVRRRPAPGSPAGAVACYFIGGRGEVDLGDVETIDRAIASQGENAISEAA